MSCYVTLIYLSINVTVGPLSRYWSQKRIALNATLFGEVFHKRVVFNQCHTLGDDTSGCVSAPCNSLPVLGFVFMPAFKLVFIVVFMVVFMVMLTLLFIVIFCVAPR